MGTFSILWHPWHSICSEDLRQAGLAFSSGLNEDVPASQSVTKTDKSQSVLASDGAQRRKEGNKAGLKIFYLEQKSSSRTGTNNFARQIWRQRAASNRILPHTAHDCRRTNCVTGGIKLLQEAFYSRELRQTNNFTLSLHRCVQSHLLYA